MQSELGGRRDGSTGATVGARSEANTVGARSKRVQSQRHDTSPRLKQAWKLIR